MAVAISTRTSMRPNERWWRRHGIKSENAISNRSQIGACVFFSRFVARIRTFDGSQIQCWCVVHIFHSSRGTVCSIRVSKFFSLPLSRSLLVVIYMDRFSLFCGRSICLLRVVLGPSRAEKKDRQNQKIKKIKKFGVQPMWREMYGFKFHDFFDILLLPLPLIPCTSRVSFLVFGHFCFGLFCFSSISLWFS